MHHEKISFKSMEISVFTAKYPSTESAQNQIFIAFLRQLWDRFIRNMLRVHVFILG